MQGTLVLSDCVNEDNMVGEHPSYHQAITGGEAERRLKQCGTEHCYLTRYSKEHKCYVLSVYEYQLPPQDNVMEHFQIVIQKHGGKLHIRKKTQNFDDIRSLLLHYERNRIDPTLRSIGEAYTEKEYKRVQHEEMRRQNEAEKQKERQQDAAQKKCTIS